MFFRGNTRKRLEPVRKMRYAVFDCPVLHGVGDGVGDFDVQRLVFRNALFQEVVDIFRKALFHNAVVKDLAAEDRGKFFHVISPFS